VKETKTAKLTLKGKFWLKRGNGFWETFRNDRYRTQTRNPLLYEMPMNIFLSWDGEKVNLVMPNEVNNILEMYCGLLRDKIPG